MVKLLLHSLLSLRIGTYYNQGLLISWAYITSNDRAFYTIVSLPLNLKLLALHKGVIHVDFNHDGIPGGSTIEYIRLHMRIYVPECDRDLHP